jgi:protein TonB
MANETNKAPAFDDIVFEIRNKEYGAYSLRKRYSRNMLIAMAVGIIILGTAVITPYLNAKALENRTKRAERQVEIKMENLDQPDHVVAPPPPPPPPAEAIQQARYVPPVVVDSVDLEENAQLMTADQATEEVQNLDVMAVQEEVKEEVQEEEAEPEPFVVVEEMPMFPGGDIELLRYINEHTNYPDIAKENNIQGRVIVRFCVTSKGLVNQVSVLKGVDPELDAEAVRVVSSLPTFKPGKQGGKPVPVWYMVPITFTLK